MTYKGIDVSRYNSSCDFKKAKASGIDFVILKTGSGVNPLDPKFEEYYKKAKEAGLNVGCYWYCYAKNVEQAKTEAKLFLEKIKGKQFEYPIYLDLEDKVQSNLGNKIRTDIVIAFCDVMERAGYYIGVYSMKSWFDNSFDMSKVGNYDLWVARWGSQEHGYSGRGKVGMWQYTNRAHVNGISDTGEGGVDANISYLNYPEIIKRHGLNGFSKNQTQKNETKDYIDDSTKIINKMRAWIGKSESNGQHKDIIDIYNNHSPLPRSYKVKYTDEWCATTISAAAIQCGLVDLIGKECSVQRFIDIFKSKNIWIEDGSITPLPGDIICYNWDDTSQPNDGWADHIGLVEKVENNIVYVIEGNTNEVVARKQYRVGNGCIRGFARPKYSTGIKTEVKKMDKKKIVIYKSDGDLDAARLLSWKYSCEMIPDDGTINTSKYGGKDKYDILYVGTGKDRFESALIALNRYK